MQNEQPVQPESPEKLEDIIRGLKISYWGRHHQAHLDAEVRGDEIEFDASL